MTVVANNPGEFSLGSANDSTGWLDLDSIVDDFAFNITGTFVGTIQLQVSNQSDYTKTRYSVVTSYTATSAPLNIPRELGRYVRLIMTAYTSGAAYVGISKGLNQDGNLVNITAQTNTGSPTGQFA